MHAKSNGSNRYVAVLYVMFVVVMVVVVAEYQLDMADLEVRSWQLRKVLLRRKEL